MAISSPGIGSNLDVNSIVSQLMAVESRPLTLLNKKEASYLAKVSAFGTLGGALSSFQSALASLSTPSKFQGVSASSADSAIVSGTATSKAVAGSYAIDVTRLAQAQTISTAAQASTSTPIGDGLKTTLTFQFGTISGGTLQNGVYVNDPAATPAAPSFTQDASKAGGSVVIDSTNNSLQGIRDAINKAAIGVTATIVSDGSATPNHLVLTSNATGETSSMKIAVTRDPLDPANTALADLLGYDAAGVQNMTQSSAAQSTALTVNGIAVTGSGKTISEAIQGVTLTLGKVGSSTLTVSRDTASVQSSVSTFVKAYNDLDKTIKNLSGYDAATKTGGALLGDSSVRNIQAQVRSMLGTSLPEGALTNLTQVGITFQKDGSLALDSAKLTTAITNNFSDIAGLFASMGSASDSLVNYVSSTSLTKPTSGALYVSALATRGQLVATNAPGNMTITTGSNDQLTMTVDGVAASVTLAANTYTSSSLVAQMQSAINGASAFSSAGISVTVSADLNGILSITSNRYGSTSSVSASGSGASNLLPTPTSTTGKDVAGTIDGVAADGSGQFLTGATGTDAAGLKLEVTGGAAPADRGRVAFSQGYADLLNKMLDNFIGSSGLISGQTNSLQSSIKSIGTARDAMNLKLAGIEKRYRAQFNALDATISKMTSTSNYLTQQLAQLSNTN